MRSHVGSTSTNAPATVPASQYHNVFFYFRGPSAKALGQPQNATQVEDNTTKALVNLLELVDEDLASSWLASLRIDPGLNTSDWRFFLQRGPEPCTATDRRLVIITAGDDASKATWAESTADKGRIDAAIYWPGEILVAVESKVTASLDGGQLIRHAGDWGIPVPVVGDGSSLPEEWIFTTWADVYEWARAELGRDHTALTRLLLEQFAEYLEIIGVTPFAGFRPEDFALLIARRRALAATADGAATSATDVTDPAQASLVKDRVEKLWKAVMPRLTPEEQHVLGEIRVGNLKETDDRVWAVTNWGEDGVNFTFELAPNQLELDLVAWNAHQADRFEKWLASSQGHASLDQVTGFELVVWRRRAMKSKSGTPFYMHATNTEVESFSLPAPTDLLQRLKGFRADCERDWELLAYHLRKSWPREEVLDLQEHLVDEAVTSLKSAIPVLAEINKKSLRQATESSSATRLGKGG